MNFIYQSYPVKVIFGKPAIEAIPAEEASETKRVWLIAGERYLPLIKTLKASGEIEIVHHFRKVIQHVPSELVEEALSNFDESDVDVILAIGGGSAIGLAKALSLKTGVKNWAVPTTYSGSELTNVYGISSEGSKEVGRDLRVLPQVVFYDPELSTSLPKSLAATSSVNAMAHLIEALYSPQNNPVTYHAALHGIRILYQGMEELAEKGSLDACINEKMLFGAYLGGKSLCEVSMGLHHKAAHVLGGSFGMEHSKVHTVLLPYVLAYQWPYLDSKIKNDLSDVFASEFPPEEIREIATCMGAATDLKSIGFKRHDTAEAARLICQEEHSSPAPVEPDLIEVILLNAWDGQLQSES